MTGFCIFGEEMVCLEVVLKTKYIFSELGMWECSSVVKHSTADREVGGSVPLVPFFIITVTFRKTFDVWKIYLAYYFEQRRNMNLAFSSYFIAIYDRLLYFWEEMVCLEIVLKTKYIFSEMGMCEFSSVVEHWSADREVGRSIPLAPSFVVVGFLSKDFRRLKD